MTREARTGLACLGVILVAIAFVGLIFVAGVASQPKQVMAETSEQEIR